MATTPAAFIVFVSTIALSLYGMRNRSSNFYSKWILSPPDVYYEKKYIQLITSGLLHTDLPHLLFNMFTFLFFAFQLEAMAGTFNFIIIYFGSMILSDISTVIKHKDNYSYHSVGASGAISGVLFSFILFDPVSKIRIMLIPVGIPSPIFALMYLAYCYYAARHSQDMINHDAHFWGAAAGIVITSLLEPAALSNFIQYLAHLF